jgi:hypothetical protein
LVDLNINEINFSCNIIKENGCEFIKELLIKNSNIENLYLNGKLIIIILENQIGIKGINII